MIYYTIEELEQSADGWISSDPIQYDYKGEPIGGVITFKSLKDAETFYANEGYVRATHYIGIHQTDNKQWVKERLWE